MIHASIKLFTSTDLKVDHTIIEVSVEDNESGKSAKCSRTITGGMGLEDKSDWMTVVLEEAMEKLA